jgi:hypothetical protein
LAASEAVLKVEHQGLWAATGRRQLEQTSPEFVVITYVLPGCFRLLIASTLKRRVRERRSPGRRRAMIGRFEVALKFLIRDFALFGWISMGGGTALTICMVHTAFSRGTLAVL